MIIIISMFLVSIHFFIHFLFTSILFFVLVFVAFGPASETASLLGIVPLPATYSMLLFMVGLEVVLVLAPGSEVEFFELTSSVSFFSTSPFAELYELPY